MAMTRVIRAAMAMMTNNNGHDNDHDDDNVLTGDSERLLLTDSSIQLCFIFFFTYPKLQLKSRRECCSATDRTLYPGFTVAVA